MDVLSLCVLLPLMKRLLYSEQRKQLYNSGDENYFRNACCECKEG